MNTRELLLSHKYAQAFINVFIEQLNYEDIDKIYSWLNFFKTRDYLMFYLRLPTIKDDEKYKALIKTREHYHLKDSFDKLIKLLLEHKRIVLLPQVLRSIIEIYKCCLNIVEFTFSSAQDLTEEDYKLFKSFLENKTSKAIRAHTKIDKNLIAGVKLYSDQLLWEYSIKKYIDSL